MMLSFMSLLYYTLEEAPSSLDEFKYKAESFWTPSLDWNKSTSPKRHLHYFPVNPLALIVNVQSNCNLWCLVTVLCINPPPVWNTDIECVQRQFGNWDGSLMSYFLYVSCGFHHLRRSFRRQVLSLLSFMEEINLRVN